MIHRAPINSNVVLTWSAGLSSISRRLNTADLIARFSERRIKDSAFKRHTAIGIGDRRSTVVSQCRNNNVWLPSATAEINVLEIDWARSYLSRSLPPRCRDLSFLCRRFYKRTDTSLVNPWTATAVAARLNRIIILILTRHRLITHLCRARRALISHKRPTRDHKSVISRWNGHSYDFQKQGRFSTENCVWRILFMEIDDI